MTRCINTGLSIPECSCRDCLLALVRTHAPRPAAPQPASAPSTDAREDRSKAA